MQLEKAVRMGPYLVKSHGEPQPVVETAERF